MRSGTKNANKPYETITGEMIPIFILAIMLW